MAQDLTTPPSAAALANAADGPISEREREYYTDMPCAEGQGCGGEGVVLPFDPGNTALDEMFGFTDVEAMPLSDEVLPVIFDGALLTEDGLLDCFARHYPERAGFLLQLLSDEGDLALGYTFAFTDDAVQAAPMRQALSEANSRYNELSAEQARLRGSTRSQLMMGGDPSDVMAEGQRLEGDLINLRNQIRDYETQLSRFGRWDIDDGARIVRVYTTINTNVERAPLAEYVPGGDDGINPLPTNKEGADWLYAVMGDWMARNGYPGAGSEEEFFRNWLTRVAAGVTLVGLGAVEMFGGVTVAIGSGGLAAVGGVALTAVGFDTLGLGVKMLWTPDRHASERGWIGDLVHDTAMHFGGEETAQAFDRGWAVTQIVAGLGAPVVIRYAATRATRVAASGNNIRPIMRGQLDEARLGIAEVKGHRFGPGLVGDYAVLPSARGAILTLGGVRPFRVPIFDSDIRVLLRLRGARAGQVQERSTELGQGMAGFARGPVSDQGKAISFVHEVGRHMGLNAADIRAVAGRIQFGQSRNGVLRASSFSFNPLTGSRTLHIRQNVGTPLSGAAGPYNELRAFLEVAHELNHALLFQRYLSRGGSMSRYRTMLFDRNRIIDTRGRTRFYYREEVRVETAAQDLTTSVSLSLARSLDDAGRINDASHVRRLLAEALAESRDVIDEAKNMLRQR